MNNATNECLYPQTKSRNRLESIIPLQQIIAKKYRSPKDAKNVSEIFVGMNEANVNVRTHYHKTTFWLHSQQTKYLFHILCNSYSNHRFGLLQHLYRTAYIKQKWL